jgi:hypothetical protein
VPACDCFEQVIATERSTRLLDKGEQQFELRAPQQNVFAAGADEGAGRRVERKTFKGQGYRIFGGHSPRSRFEIRNVRLGGYPSTRVYTSHFLPKNYKRDIGR